MPKQGSAPALDSHACHTKLKDFFIGNVRIRPHAKPEFVDNIAMAFHQSSRKTLHFILPVMQKGEVVIRPSLLVVEDGSKRWLTRTVGYFLGNKPYFPHLEAYAKSTWPLVHQVTTTLNEFYFIKFKTEAAMDEVIEGGPWLFQGQPIMLQCWALVCHYENRNTLRCLVGFDSNIFQWSIRLRRD
ncbi:UNVERIFIED_CONTAM: hypothetical protein Sradi_5704900 [Sesamum radiatum]|uniref:DUF4283 domain-containing protein n=1 Tax=Sesamum radiatum TaxID=300843 RepID=A0AAW2L484_SESRA